MAELSTRITISAKAAQALKELAKVTDEFKALGDGARKGGAEAEAAVGRARRETRALSTDARRAATETDNAFSRAARGGVRSLRDGITRVRRELIALFAAKLSIQGLVGLGAIADQMTLIDSRLRLVSRSQAEFNAAQRGTLDIARRTGQPLQETVQLYARLVDAVRALGGSQAETLQLTETINQAIVVSGASASASAAGIQQLAQAFASGVLRGDEFNSVMENTPRVAKAIADGLGVPIGALRQMAEEGELTADVITKALAGQADVIEREFGQMPLTIGRAFQNLRTEFEQFVARADKSTGASRSLAQSIQFLAENIDTLARAVVTLGQALLFVFGGAVIGRALTSLRALSAGVGAVNGALALFVGGAVLARLAKLGATARGGLLGFALFGTYTLAKYVAEITGITDAASRLIDKFKGLDYDPNAAGPAAGPQVFRGRRPGGRGQPPAAAKELTEADKERLKNLQALIDKSLEQAATTGLSARELALYEAAQLKASAADVKAINAAFDVIESKQRQAQADKEGESASRRAGQAEEQRLASLASLVASYREQAETLGLTARQLAQYEAAQLGATAADWAAIDAAFARIEAAEREERLREQQRADAEALEQSLDAEADAWERIDEARRQDAEAIRQQIDPFRALNQELARAQELLQFNAISSAEFDAVAANIRTRIQEVQADLDRAKSGFSEFAVQAARNIQTSLADFLFDPFQDGLKGMLDSFERTLRRMAAEATAAQIGKKLFGDFGAGASGGGSGKIGGYIGKAMELLAGIFHTGGVIGMPPVSRRVPALAFAGAPRFHSGGVLGLAPDEVPIIGRRGEEVLTADDPRHRNNGGGTVNIAFTVQASDADSFRRSQSQIEAMLRQATERGLRNL